MKKKILQSGRMHVIRSIIERSVTNLDLLEINICHSITAVDLNFDTINRLVGSAFVNDNYILHLESVSTITVWKIN